MDRFAVDIQKYFEVINLEQLITDSVHSNRPYVTLDLTIMLDVSPHIYKQLTSEYVYKHVVIRSEIRSMANRLGFVQLIEPVYFRNPVLHTLKDLTCSLLYKLSTFRATVTRTSSVRPELSVGCFECCDCFSRSLVVQKSVYTLPTICTNSLCKNKFRFNLVADRSEFNDWQKVFCQESYLEVKNGLMPRSMVLHARDFCCEMLNPGDTCLVTGILTVVEDNGFSLVFVVNFVETEDLISERFDSMLRMSERSRNELKNYESNLTHDKNIESKVKSKENKEFSDKNLTKPIEIHPKKEENMSDQKNEDCTAQDPNKKAFSSEKFQHDHLSDQQTTHTGIDGIIKQNQADSKNRANLPNFSRLENLGSENCENVDANVVTNTLKNSRIEYSENIIDFEEKNKANSELGGFPSLILDQKTDNRKANSDNEFKNEVNNNYEEKPADIKKSLIELRIVDYGNDHRSLIGLEQFILAIANTPNLYSELAESLFPHIYGHTLVKRGILLMLAQGSQKSAAGARIRGDINILLVGDPGTAKSAFLRETAGVLPRSVYTSGRGSSAAGLTAAVVRDTEGEFTVEAGCLMLSDKSVCCIDEFDKMDRTDATAIHEAMEQGTITINKAGINATLNAACSVLAAANPVCGRYDMTRSLRANINLSDAIMSRFDLFFVVIDAVDELNDELIADRIIDYHSEGAWDLDRSLLIPNQTSSMPSKEGIQMNNLHDSSLHSQHDLSQSNFFTSKSDLFDLKLNNNSNGDSKTFNGVFTSANYDQFDQVESTITNQNNPLDPNIFNEDPIIQKKPRFTIEEIREYLLYIRKNIHPTISEEANALIIQKYIKIRQDSLINPTNYKVTVRQLESLIRLSEAIAKIHCETVVTPDHVHEAYNLLKGSTIEIKNEDVVLTKNTSKESLTISKKDYTRILHSLVYILKTKDFLNKEELANEYLLLREDRIESVEQLSYEEGLAKAVILHLIEKEGVLFEMDNYVHIHPNYDV